MNSVEKINFANNTLLGTKNNAYMFKEHIFVNMFPEIYKEICDIKFPDYFTFSQKLWHYIYDDYDFNKCCTCEEHGKLSFLDFRRGYAKFCRPHCSAYNEYIIKKSIETRIKNSGSIEESYKKGLNKQRKTCIERYGISNGGGTKESIEKGKLTKKERYGDENYVNAEKGKLTKKERYGDENYVNVEKRKITVSKFSHTRLNEINQKRKDTIIQRYGTIENYHKIVSQKIKDTCLELYGVDNVFKRTDIIEKNKERIKECTVNKYDEIISISDGIYHCKCIDTDCNLCKERCFDIDLHNFFNRKFYKLDLCTNRSPIKMCAFTSGAEKQLLIFIKSIYSGEIIENDRKIINGKELDIYLPEKKIAFEFNGIYWHSELYKDKNYHQQKSIECIKNGIQLVHIWEDDWINNQDVVKDIIISKIGLEKIKIDARKCNVKEVANKDAIRFLNQYHIQGAVKNGKSIGLFYNDELVEIMTFGGLRKNMGGNPVEGRYEIYRVASKSGYKIQGGFSKLLNFFERNYKPNEIITYANLDYSIGDVYNQCGFIEDKISKPTYTWVVGMRRKHMSNSQKSNLIECKEHPELTENDVMYSRGCIRCWDAGKIKFRKVYN